MKLNKYFYMAVGGAVTLAIAGAAVMFSQTTSAASFEEAPLAIIDVFDEVQRPPRPDGPGGPGGPRGEAAEEFILAELGITEEEFDAAREAAREAAVADALEAGIITEEQAENLLNGNGNGRRGFRGAPNQGAEYLADALGITVEELETALENAREAALGEALAEGLITQEQYDGVQARQALREFVDREAIMAAMLGVTVEEIEAARADRTLHELVEAAGLTRDEMQAAMQAAHEAAVAEAIEAGVITAEQAEALQNGPGFGGPGGHGPRGHGQGGSGGPRGDGQGQGPGNGQGPGQRGGQGQGQGQNGGQSGPGNQGGGNG